MSKLLLDVETIKPIQVLPPETEDLLFDSRFTSFSRLFVTFWPANPPQPSFREAFPPRIISDRAPAVNHDFDMVRSTKRIKM